MNPYLPIAVESFERLAENLERGGSFIWVTPEGEQEACSSALVAKSIRLILEAVAEVQEEGR